MSEALYIEMPTRKSGKKSLWLRLLPLWALVLLLLGGIWLWLAQGRIVSAHAFLDAMIHVVAPEFSRPWKVSLCVRVTVCVVGSPCCA